uniref:No apical meristem-associated C-terminal domain-containing protein n=1 Tax=Brassica oleracea var. oleracea TaxID=109376 RepID=A0A0D3CMY5_BRAOL
MAFWKRIATYFGASPQVAGLQKRDSTGCKSRWGKLNEGVCKFVGCYDAATKQKSSGQSEDDVLKLAHQIFFNDYKSKFTLEHAWLEQSHDQKWCGGLASKNGVSSKRRKVDNQTGQSSTSVPCSLGEEDANGVEVRPAGVKAAKRLSKAAVRKANTEEAEGKIFRMKHLINFGTNNSSNFTLTMKIVKQLQSQKKRAYIERQREQGHMQLWNDYFSEDATYPSHMFRRRFRMNKPLFMRIVDRLSAEIPYFQQRRDATGRFGHSPLQKATTAIRMMTYGCPADAVDEYLRLSETTALLCLEHFVQGIIDLFGEEYLRRPTPEDLQRLLDTGEERGFPGMIGSIDCMHWEWKNCPTAWKGQYTRGSGKPTIVLEAVASEDVWIWHAFFGPPGTLNDINVLDRSPIFDDILQGRAPIVNYTVNGHNYRLAYYLTDGIYPNWATFVQSIREPQGPKASLFATKQEAVRKDVERAFGVLQARFAIVKNPALLWDKIKIGKIMRACIILHNMIVEDERDKYTLTDVSVFEQPESSRSSHVDLNFSTQMPTNLHNVMGMLTIRNEVRDNQIHQRLKADLVENIWQKFGTPQDFN